jgi:hypothetical protein
MLDLDKASILADKFISKITKKDFLKWLAMDKLRAKKHNKK